MEQDLDDGHGFVNPARASMRTICGDRISLARCLCAAGTRDVQQHLFIGEMNDGLQRSPDVSGVELQFVAKFVHNLIQKVSHEYNL